MALINLDIVRKIAATRNIIDLSPTPERLKFADGTECYAVRMYTVKVGGADDGTYSWAYYSMTTGDRVTDADGLLINTTNQL